MTQPPKPFPPASPPVDPRIALVAERTLLAWMRTGLAMMGFGFVVARFGLFLRALANLHDPATTGAFSRWMGVVLVLLGVVVNGFAAAQHTLILTDTSIVDRRRRVSGWVAVGLSVVLAMVGMAMAAYIVQMR